MLIKGTFHGLIIKKDGTTVSWNKDNMIVDSGWNFIINSMFQQNNRSFPLSYIALGNGQTATTAQMTALENEIIRVPATWEVDETGRSVALTAQMTVQEPLQISEAGIFNAETGGIMFDRVTFSPKGLDETDLAKPLFRINFIG